MRIHSKNLAFLIVVPVLVILGVIAGYGINLLQGVIGDVPGVAVGVSAIYAVGFGVNRLFLHLVGAPVLQAVTFGERLHDVCWAAINSNDFAPDAGTIKRSLNACLEELTPEQFASLNIRQIDCLRMLLTPDFAQKHPYSVAEIIKALVRAGAPDFNIAVERLTHDYVMEPARGVAFRCLPSLEMFTKSRDAHGTLVRSSECPGTGDERLMRPANCAEVCGLDSLLRFSVSPHGEE